MIKGNIEISENVDRVKVKPIEFFSVALDKSTPKLIQDFVSLEGEGGTIGRSALYIRLGKCNAACAFCDTSFSIEGKEKYNIVDTTTTEFIDYLENKYTAKEKKYIKNLSITGGEPLLHINNMDKTIQNILRVFPNIENIIFETNGTILSNEENCYKLLKKIGTFPNHFHFLLSISPKLSSAISYSKSLTDEDVMEIYKKVINNYNHILDRHCGIQVKFIYEEDLVKYNELLMNYILDKIDRNSILIMPFTPDDPLGKRKDVWLKSKNDAANYALQNHFRYSPRIHIDRQLD